MYSYANGQLRAYGHCPDTTEHNVSMSKRQLNLQQYELTVKDSSQTHTLLASTRVSIL